MSKQKTSYSVTSEADRQLSKLSGASGLSKSAVIEVLIRQAFAAEWSIANGQNARLAHPMHENSCGVYPAARLLGVTQSTISIWSRTTDGLPFTQQGHKRIYKESDLLNFAHKNGRIPRFKNLEDVYLDTPSLRGK